MNKKTYISIILFILCAVYNHSPLMAQVAQDSIAGIYSVTDEETKEESRVKIYLTNHNTYAGKIIWVKNLYYPDGTMKTDINNPDKNLRNTPGNKIQLLWDFTFNPATGEWINGKVYDPIHGRIYKCKMKFEAPNKLKVRGYIGTPALGRTVYWKKISR